MFDGKRLAVHMKKTGYTSKRLTEALNNLGIEITEPSINAYRQGRANPRIEVLCGMAELLNIAEQELFENRNVKAKKFLNKNRNGITIPLIEINSSANILSRLSTCREMCLDTVMISLEDTESIIGVHIIGDAMYPTFVQNDIVLVELIKESSLPTRDNIYLINYADIIQLKRIQYLNDQEIALISLNKDYPIINTNIEECKVLGNIKMKINVEHYAT